MIVRFRVMACASLGGALCFATVAMAQTLQVNPATNVAPRPAPAPTPPPVIVSTNAPAPANDPALTQVEFANRLYTRQFYDMALAEYVRFTQQFDEHALAEEVYYRIGECLRHLKLAEQAKRNFQIVTRRWPGGEFSGRAHFRLGEMAYDAGEVNQAMTLFTAAVHQTRDDAVRTTAQFYLGRAQLDAGLLDAALENFRRVLKSKSGASFVPYAEAATASIYLKKGDQAQALAHYETVVAMAATPELREEALYQVGAMRYALKKYPEAITGFQQFLKDFPKSRMLSNAVGGLVRALFLAGRSRECATAARDYFNQMPAEFKQELALLVASSMREQKAYREAADWFAKVGTPEGNTEELRCAFLAGDYARVLQRGDALVKSNPSAQFIETAMMLMAESIEAQKQWAQAAAAYHALLERVPNTAWAADALWRAATCWQCAPKLDEAAKDYERFATSFAGDKRAESAWYQLGLCYGQADKRDAMVKAFGKLLALYPNSGFAAESHYWVGVNFFGAQQWADVVEQLEKAVALDAATNQPRVTAKLMLAYYHLDQPAKADLQVQALLKRKEAAQVPAEISAWLGGKWLAVAKPELALPHLQRALETTTDRGLLSDAHETMALCHVALTQWDKVAAHYRDVLEIEKENARGMRAALGLAEALVRGGSYNEAQPTLEKLLDLKSEGPESARIRMLLGDLHAGRSEYREAARYYMLVAAAYDDPSIVPIVLDRAAAAFDACGRTGDATQARRELQQRFPNYHQNPLASQQLFTKPTAGGSKR